MSISLKLRFPRGHLARAGGLVLAATIGLSGLNAKQQNLFRASVDYVRLDVVVTDDDDRPVAGLRREDFRLFDDGHEQQIADFVQVVVPSSEATGDKGDSPLRGRLDVATNIATSPESRAVVIVVDDQHLIEADIVSLKQLCETSWPR